MKYVIISVTLLLHCSISHAMEENTLVNDANIDAALAEFDKLQKADGDLFANDNLDDDNDQGPNHREIYLETKKNTTFNEKELGNQPLKIDPKKRRWACEFPGCQFECGSSSSLSRHRIAEHKKNFECTKPDCTSSFETQELLNMHLSRPHHKPDLMCIPCKKTFTLTTSLSRHNKEVHGDINTKHRCPLCNYCYSRTSSLKRHVCPKTRRKPTNNTDN